MGNLGSQVTEICHEHKMEGMWLSEMDIAVDCSLSLRGGSREGAIAVVPLFDSYSTQTLKSTV